MGRLNLDPRALLRLLRIISAIAQEDPPSWCKGSQARKSAVRFFFVIFEHMAISIMGSFFFVEILTVG
jgi:hypothetical protein